MWQAVERDAQGHTKKATSSVGQKSGGLEKPQDKKYFWQQDQSARRGGSHLPPDAEESETSFLFFFWGENSFLKLSIIFSLTPSREQTVLFASDSQILNPLFPLLVTHESDSFTSR